MRWSVAEIDGEMTLVDWKSSKSVAWPSGQVYAEMRLQLAAYAHAEFSARVGDPERYPVPAIQKYGIAHITDGGTKFYPVDINEDDWIAFRAALCLYRWREGGKSR